MKRLKDMIAAFQFLTVLPLPVATGAENLRRSMVWYPLAGMVCGVVTGFGFQGLLFLFPERMAAVLTILLYIVFTRGLHLDGFMDTIDGFFSHKQRDEILRIMKDPHVGSFGVLAAGIWFLVLFTTLPVLQPMDFIVIHTVTRCSILLLPLLFSYPRESGTGKFFVENVTGKTVVAALAVFLILPVAAYCCRIPGRGAVGYSLFLPLTLAICLLCGFWARRKIGGITGDLLGFSIEINHMVLLLVAAV